MRVLAYIKPSCHFYEMDSEEVLCQSGANSVPIDYEDEEIPLN